ncbi:hypothetical protein SUNI508_01147 [Seiridium unicorne]|uniref:2EXR domain-containing protein n=1 Tax=Seiridium unicorne TaxID=138068 RepID=A0ABR2UWV9_9PEZI
MADIKPNEPSFHKFGSLPKELRLHIWEDAARTSGLCALIVAREANISSVHNNDARPFLRFRYRISPIFRVSTESRKAAEGLAAREKRFAVTFFHAHLNTRFVVGSSDVIILVERSSTDRYALARQSDNDCMSPKNLDIGSGSFKVITFFPGRNDYWRLVPGLDRFIQKYAGDGWSSEKVDLYASRLSQLESPGPSRWYPGYLDHPSLIGIIHRYLSGGVSVDQSEGIAEFRHLEEIKQPVIAVLLKKQLHYGGWWGDVGPDNCLNNYIITT